MHVVINEPARLLDLATFLRKFDISSRAAGFDQLEVTVDHGLNAARDPAADRLAVVRALRDFCEWNPGVRTDVRQ